MIREVRKEDYDALFKGHIKRDFARQERRPLAVLRRLYDRGQYTILTLHNDETGALMAYAALLYSTALDSMLLDYLAVEPEYRKTGVGSRFMREIAVWRGTGGILIECESPKQAKNVAEKKDRGRRIAFYKKSGAVETGVCWFLRGIHFELLWLPVNKTLQEVNVAQDIVQLYGIAVPQGILRFFAKVQKSET